MYVHTGRMPSTLWGIDNLLINSLGLGDTYTRQLNEAWFAPLIVLYCKFVNYTLCDKFQWNLNGITKAFYLKMAFDNGVCNSCAILTEAWVNHINLQWDMLIRDLFFQHLGWIVVVLLYTIPYRMKPRYIDSLWYQNTCNRLTNYSLYFHIIFWAYVHNQTLRYIFHNASIGTWRSLFIYKISLFVVDWCIMLSKHIYILCLGLSFIILPA